MDENSMGFYKNGSQAKSVTDELTKELEGIRAKKAAREAKGIAKNEPMHWAFEGQKWEKHNGCIAP